MAISEPTYSSKITSSRLLTGLVDFSSNNRFMSIYREMLKYHRG